MKKYLLLLLLSLAYGGKLLAQSDPGLLISEYLANPAGTDSPFEYVELVATRDINFATTPFCVVFANNGTATVNGWIEGNGITYGFNINSGSVTRGQVVYVGGSSMAPTGTKLRTLNTGTTAGDRLGNFNTTGVLGNGGASADAIGVFNVDISALTASTVPVDALFFGLTMGTAVLAPGTDGYQLPVNDRYTGGKLQTSSYFTGVDPANGFSTYATGTFDLNTNTFTTTRTWLNSAVVVSDNTTTVSLTLPSATPAITLTGSLNAFTTAVGTPSATQSYTVSGANLAADITLTAPTDFEISKTSGGPFSSTLSLAQASGTVASTTIYVRFNPATSGAKSGNISHVSGTTSQNIAVSGTNPAGIITIAQARALPIGSSVLVQGIVTVARQFGSNEIFFQDATGGLSVFISDNNAQLANLNIGDQVQVSGRTSEFQPTTGVIGSGRLQISGTAAQVTVTRTATAVGAPAPQVVTLSQFAENLEGQLITVRNTTFTETGFLAGESNFTLSDASASGKQVRMDIDTDFFAPDNNTQVSSTIPTGATAVTGVLTQFRGTYQLQPRFLTDIPASRRLRYVSTTKDAVPLSQTLDVATWNMEWFGTSDPTLGPTDKALQAENAARVLSNYDFDLIAVQEVVSDAVFQSTVARLNVLKPGNNYVGIAPPVDSSQSQRPSFIYKSTVITPIGVPRFSFKSGPLANSWASFMGIGRWPFELEFNFQAPGAPPIRIRAITLHGKAGGTAADQPRRVGDYQQLKTYLDTQRPNERLIVLGDWNDKVVGSISSTATAPLDSPMKPFVDDAANYRFATLNLQNYGLISQNSGAVIDHILVSNELFGNLIDSTTRVTNPTALVANYINTTSDHYPVWTRLCPAKPVITQSGSATDTSPLLYLVSNYLTGNQWLKDGVEIAGATAQNYRVTAAGTYQVRNNQATCTLSDPLVLTANETSLEAGPQLSLYPNPASDKVQIRYTALGTAKSLQVNVYDLLGKLVGTQPLSQTADGKWETSLNIANYAAGQYILRVEGLVKRFIKQ